MITRRTMTIGTLAALAWPARLLAAGPLVPFQLRVFIPSPGVSYLGDLFGGGDKAILEGAIDMDNSGAGALSLTARSLGATRRYSPSAAKAVAEKPDWYVSLAPGAAAIETGQSPLTNASLSASWEVPAGATHGVKFVVDAANPLVTAAPAIDAVIRLGLRRTGSGVEYQLSGDHDGFPSYQIKLGAGALVYNYDCVAAGDTPAALFPPMDRTVTSSGWKPLTI
jgi:hypothetical protein